MMILANTRSIKIHMLSQENISRSKLIILQRRKNKILKNLKQVRGNGNRPRDLPMMKMPGTGTFWRTQNLDQSSSVFAVTGSCQGVMLLSSLHLLRPKSKFLWRTAFLTWMSTLMSLSSEMEKKYLLTTGTFTTYFIILPFDFYIYP